MSLNPQKLQRTKPKHLYYCPGGSSTPVTLIPRLYIEAKIDFADVRSGLNETCSCSRALEICSFEGDAIWTDDMVFSVEAKDLLTVAPPFAELRADCSSVESVDLSSFEARFQAYVLRSFKVKLFRNFHLNIYSRFGESLQEFQVRCVESLIEPFRRELDLLHDVFDRSLEQLRERYLRDDGWAAFDRVRLAAQHRSEFRDVAERITSRFINSQLTLEPVTRSRYPALQGADLSQRLASLDFEASEAVNKLHGSFREKALNIDEYIIHPSFKDIHLVRSCIVWMPEVLR